MIVLFLVTATLILGWLNARETTLDKSTPGLIEFQGPYDDSMSYHHFRMKPLSRGESPYRR
jgi:hypothetical protein